MTATDKRSDRKRSTRITNDKKPEDINKKEKPEASLLVCFLLMSY